MRVAILESIIMPAGHEVEFDRILVDELKRQGHEPVFFVPVKLIVQGATAKPEDGELFEQFARDYAKYPAIEFWHKNLIGLEWQKALLGVDAIMIWMRLMKNTDRIG